MSMEIKQHLKLSQQLVMTPQLQQAIKLLQLSRMELVDLVRDEMMENPIPEEEEQVGMLIIGNLDLDGYLKEPPLAEIVEEAGVSLEVAEKVLSRIQQFDPVGIAARSLQECLLIQARHVGADDDILVRVLR